MNLNSTHFNEAYAAETEFGERLVNNLIVVAMDVGMSVIDVSMNATATSATITYVTMDPFSTAIRCSPKAK